ncbi:programmed cell death protein 1 [Dendropsophus ebraccatus]|uniref:programmed cell death protein 1 n=1 Tax=Dendropsophus ebraccatus TaxID=150705 RepID=UPI0038315E9B
MAGAALKNKRRGNETPPLSLMRMERLRLIVLSICVSIALGYASPEATKFLFIHSPPSLTLPPGANATFTCNISALEHEPGDMNWYITQNASPNKKIADLKGSQNTRLYITIHWERHQAQLHIVNVQFNDSGRYHCSHVNLTGQIIASNSSELTVKNFTGVPCTVPDQNAPRVVPESAAHSLTMPIVSTAVSLGLLLLLAIASAVIFIWYRQRNNIPQSQQQDLEKIPQDHSVYTVDYGVLEFGANQPYRKSPEPSVPEQVEYATIMFPQHTPSLGEKRGKSPRHGYNELIEVRY